MTGDDWLALVGGIALTTPAAVVIGYRALVMIRVIIWDRYVDDALALNGPAWCDKCKRETEDIAVHRKLWHETHLVQPAHEKL